MNKVRMPRYSMAEDTFPGSFDSAPQIFSSDTTFRRSAQDDKMEVHSLKQAVTSQMQKGPSSTHLLINSVVLRCRSGFRLRAPAALTPAKQLNLPIYQLTHLPIAFTHQLIHLPNSLT